MNLSEVVEDGKQAHSTSQQDSSQSQPGDGGKTVTLSGKTFQVSDDLAEAFSEHTRGIDQRFSERAKELGELRQYKATHQSPPADNGHAYNQREKNLPQEDLSELMFTDPSRYNQIMMDKMQNAIDNTKKELTQRYEADKQSEKEGTIFWNNMWAENKDLALIKKEATDVIGLVGAKYHSLDLPNTKEVRDMLANEAREWLKGVGYQNKTNNTDTDSFMERTSSSQPGGNVSTKNKEPERRSTKSILEKLQGDRAAAMANRK